MQTEQLIVSGTLAASLVLFVWGPWRYDLVALAALLCLVVSGIIPADQAFEGFGHPAVVTVAAVLIMSRALELSGMVDAIAVRLERLSASPVLLLGALCGLVTVFSAFMNNIGALALLLPVAVQLTSRTSLPRHVALMPLAFGSILGGMTTLVGTPPNIIISSYREQELGAAFAVFDFAPVGVAVAAGGVVLAVICARFVLPVREKEGSSDFYLQIEPYIVELTIPEDSRLVGLRLRDLEDLGHEDAAIIELIRPDALTLAPRRWTKIRAGDVVVLETDPETLKSILDSKQVELAHEKQFDPEHLVSDEVKIVEAVIMPGSRAEARTSSGLRLRSNFGINLLAISRTGGRVERRIGHERLRVGDVLLLQGDAERMQESLARLGCLPLGQRQLKLTRGFEYLPVAIFAAALVCASLGWLKAHIALSLGALALVGLRSLPLREAYESIDWPIIVLLGAMVPVGASLESTGITELIAQSLGGGLAGAPGWLVILVLLLVALLLSNIINNAATAILMAPLGIAIAARLGMPADALLMAVAIGSSAAFLTPIGHQSNLLVMGPGAYTFSDYWRLGLPVSLVVCLIAVPLIMFVWGG